MPTLPIVSDLSANSVGILNVIRDEASPDYRNAVPIAKETTESIRNVGSIILGYEARRNEFINALINRIGLVLVTSKMYSNPLRMFKKGMVELGESIEEIFVEIARPYQYDPGDAENTIFKRHIPGVKSMFHATNFQKFYPITVSRQQLQKAFLSIDGITDFIVRLSNSLYSGMNYDELIMTKYVIATLYIKGLLPVKYISDYTEIDNANSVLKDVKEISNNFRFLSSDYTISGNENFSEIENQYFINSSNFSANIDVNALAKAYNLSYAEFNGKNVLINTFSFTDGELKRLNFLMESDPGYVKFTSEQLTSLSKIGGIVLDKDFLMIFDNLQETDSVQNAKGLYYNEFLHVWKTFSASPFSNVCVLTSETAPTITNVTVSPTTPAGSAGDSIQFSASVSGTGNYNSGVRWKISGNSDSKTAIGEYSGLLIIGSSESATITVTATSTQDSTKTGSTTVTVS